MGRYFGIANGTKQHKVSSGERCWKAWEFCDCHELMHRYHWEPTDDIYSACYDTYTAFRYDPETNTMETYDPELEEMAKHMREKCIKEEQQLRHNITLFLDNPDKLKNLIEYGYRLNLEYLFYTPDFVYETVKSFLETANKIPTKEYLDKLGGFIYRRLNEPGYFQTTFTTYVMNQPDETSIYTKNMAYILKSYQENKKDDIYMYSENLPHNNINEIIEACAYYGFSDEYHDTEGFLIVSDDEEDEKDVSDEDTTDKPVENKVDTYTKLGYYPTDVMEKQSNHVPKWDGNTCTVCGYEFKSLHILDDSKKFDKCFFMG